ncbi:hypothetical protein M3629_03620 [Paenibacillus polysaccharolyticus]|nr:hypothetical protein [Paenibacillus polysaccharolyticus]MCM3131856.1 hypothetical protein [Paenibacillus polysaccharolyticus]
MKLIQNMTNDELIETTQKSELDYDIRIEASKEYLKRMGVIADDSDASG